MKPFFSRAAVLVTAVALVCSWAPWAGAQSGEEAAGIELQALPEDPPSNEAAVPPAPVLEQAGEYSEGLVRITDGTLWGYADAAGSIVIPLQFDAAEDFFLGCAQVTKNGGTGLLRWDGKYLLEPKYDQLTGVGYGVWLAQRGEAWELLCVPPFRAAGETTQQLYADLASANLSTGTFAWLTLWGRDGAVSSFAVNSLPQRLAERRVPGWQFPLSPSRAAAFSDVAGSDWFDRWVNLAYSVGLMEGVGGGMFEPMRTLTVAETLRLAACLESVARQDDFHLQSVSGAQWYVSSVVYCEAIGIITPGQFSQTDYERAVTRSEVAAIFAATAPVRSITAVNDLARVRSAIPDVAAGDFAADAIYALYAKGVLSGTGPDLSFRPEAHLTRAEAAAIVSRIARPEQRITLW